MKITEELFGLISSVTVAISIILVLSLPTRFIFAMLMGVLTFLLYKYLLGSEDQNFVWKFKILSTKIKWPSFFVATYALSIISIALISPTYTFYSNWSEIPIVNWVRVILALMLTNFFPGYVILILIDRKQEFSRVAKVVFSYILSYFFTTLVSYALAASKLGFFYVFPALLIFNSILLVVFCTLFREEWKFRKYKENITEILKIKKFDLYSYLILMVLAILVFVAIFSVNFVYFPFLKGDLFAHFGTTMKYLKEGWYEWWGESQYPYWFFFNLAAFLSFSGFPTINSTMLLTFLSVMVIPAFYLMSEAFFGHRGKNAILSTLIFSLFLGLGWLYVVFLKIKSVQIIGSDETWISILKEAEMFTLLRVHPFYYEWGYKPISVSIIAFLGLLYLIFKRNLSNLSKFILGALLLVTAFSVHVEEATIFVILYLPLAMFIYRRHTTDVRTFLLSVLVGLTMVSIFDLVAHKQVYFSLPYEGSLFLTALMFLMFSLFGRKPLNLDFSSQSHRFRTLKMFVSWYLLGLSIIIYLFMFPFNAGPLYWYQGAFPWFFWPIHFGVPLILALVGYTFLVLQDKKVDENFLFAVASIIVSLAFGRLIAYLNITYSGTIITGTVRWATGYREWRIVYLTYSFIALLAGRGILFMFSKIKLLSVPLLSSPKKLFFSFLLCLLITAGSLDTLLTTERFMLVGLSGDIYGGQVSEEELEAIDFLRLNTPSTSSVLTFSWENALKVRLAGVWQWMHTSSIYNAKTNLFFSSQGISSVLHLLSSRQVKYAYFTTDELRSMSLKPWNEGFFNKYLRPLLPVAFQNYKVTIFEVPSLLPPSADPELVMVTPVSLTNASQVVYSALTLALSEAKYNILIDGEPAQFKYPKIVLPSDPPSSTNMNQTVDLEAYGSSPPVITESTVALWHFNEEWKTEASDATSNKNDGVIQGATLTIGKFNEALMFNSDDYVEVPDNLSLHVREGTIEFWFNPEGGFGSGDRDEYLLYKNAGGQHLGDFSISLRGFNGGLEFYLSDGTQRYTVLSDVSSWSEQWHHVVVTFGSEGMKMYINGRLQSNTDTSMTRGIENNKWTFYIGNTETPHNEGFKGKIDELRILNRTLSANEIRIQYLAGLDTLYKTKIKTYLDWIIGGGRLLIFNSYKRGYFANLLSLDTADVYRINGIKTKSTTIPIPETFTSSLSNSRDTEVIVLANYTLNGDSIAPFAYQKKVGNGEIIYIEVGPLFSMLTQDSFVKQEVFSKLGYILGILGFQPQQQLSPYHEYPIFFYDFFNVSGSVRITTSMFVPFDESSSEIRIKHFDFSSSKNYTVDGEKVSKSFFNDAILTEVYVQGSFSSIIRAPYLQTIEDGKELWNVWTVLPYQRFNFSNGFDWNLDLENNTTMEMKILDNNSSHLVKVKGGVLRFEVSSTSNALLMNPLIDAQGEIYFSKAFFGQPYTTIAKVFGEPLKIVGELSFQVSLSGTDASFIKDFSYEGDRDILKPQWWNPSLLLEGDWNLPWYNIVTSWPHIFLVVVIILMASILYRKRKH